MNQVEHLYGKLNKVYKDIEYKGGETDTSKTTIDDVTRKINVDVKVPVGLVYFDGEKFQPVTIGDGLEFEDGVLKVANALPAQIKVIGAPTISFAEFANDETTLELEFNENNVCDLTQYSARLPLENGAYINLEYNDTVTGNYKISLTDLTTGVEWWDDEYELEDESTQVIHFEGCPLDLHAYEIKYESIDET